MDDLKQTIMETVVISQYLKGEISKLNGKIESLDYDLRSLEKKMDANYAELTKTMKRIEKKLERP